MKQAIYLFMLIAGILMSACSKETPQPQPHDFPTPNTKGDLQEIRIKQLPEQLVYPLHSSSPINLKGLVVEGIYSDGETLPLTVKPTDIFNFSTEEENDRLPVTIRIQGKEVTFYVQVVSEVLNQVTDDGSDTYTVAPHVRIIGPKAFLNTHFTTIVLNEGLTHIGKEAFCGVPVRHINFPSTLKEIDELAFYLCQGLDHIDLSKTQLKEIKESVFNGSSIRSILFPPSLTAIADQAFLYTSQLESIELPDYVKTIGLEAFRASGITRVVLPNNIQVLGKRAFMLCENLTTVTCIATVSTCTDGIAGSSLFEKCPRLQEVTYPASIRYIERTQISENPKLTLLSLPQNLQSIGFCAFDNCQHIECIETAASLPPSLDLYAFPKNHKIKEIRVPEGQLGVYTASEVWKDYQNLMKE